MKNIKMLFNELKHDRNFNKMLSYAQNLSYKDCIYTQKLDNKKSIVLDQSNYTYIVTGATYETNYNYSLQFTKKYFKQYINKKFSTDLYNIMIDDLLYYNELYPIQETKKYLLSDISLLNNFGLIEYIGDYILVSNLLNDTVITIHKKDILTSFIYKYLFNYVSYAVVVAKAIIFLVCVFYSLFVYIALFVIYIAFMLFVVVLSRYKNSS